MSSSTYHGAARSHNTPEFVAIPYIVFTDGSLSHAAKLVYGRLKLYAGKHGRCYPKQATLAREVCLSLRQLRTVLGELRVAGWIDWKRTRTSCAYTVHPERKKTTTQSGGKLLITPEGNRQCGAAENLRQKRSVEDHHRKRGLEKNARTTEAVGTASPKPPERSNPKSQMVDDDDQKPLFTSPKDELRDIYVRKTGHQISPDVERRIWETVELRGFTKEAFMEQLRPHTPNDWKNPAGFLTNFARKLSSPLISGPPEPRKNAAGRCSICLGVGYISYDADPIRREYCECSMGRDLKRMDARLTKQPAAVTT